jgi:methionyl aminopeptidase
MSVTMKDDSQAKCMGADCDKEAGTLQCPTCLKLGQKDSFFCSQDCFKRNWDEHKTLHKKPQGFYNPFPKFLYTGSVRPVYPLSARRTVPTSIPHPEYAFTGVPKKEQRLNPLKIDILDEKGQEAMRKVCRLSREVLDIVAAEVRPGVTTDYLDQVCHQACIERQSYPSPLNYSKFPKSLCTSVNEIVCHGIPDHRVLLDGDIINLDISIFHEGYHADLNETYYVGDRAKADPDSVHIIETTRQCLAEAIKIIKPGTPFRDIGVVTEKFANSKGCKVMATWGGHGINTHFHPPPWIAHYAKNKVVGVCKPGMTFTIEPILTLGRAKEVFWPDDWTNSTIDGKRCAQFEDTLLVTETGVEVLTARKADSPGGPVPLPTSVSKTA